MSYLIVGGTGTLGKELMRQILMVEPYADIVSFSRDEARQQALKPVFPDVRFLMGDVRDKDAVHSAMRGRDVCFLLAAVKHVDIAETYPHEALKTNFQGAVNVGEAAIDCGAKYVVFSNTDKSVLPITCYGYTKALAQSHLLSLNGQSRTRFSSFLWGNVLASRGSVIPSFINSLMTDRKVKLTDERMSRFWLTVGQVASFMLGNYRSASLDEPMIPPVKAATVLRVIESLGRILEVKEFEIEKIGLRCSEKIYEVLRSTHDGCLRSDTCEQFTDDELNDLLRSVIAA